MIKKLFNLGILFILSCSTYAQIEELDKSTWTVIGELKSLGVTKAKLQYLPYKQDTTYMLFMKDMKNPKVVNFFSVSFRQDDDTYHQFYKVLKSFFISENKKDKGYEKTLKLGTTYVHIQHYPLIASHGIMFSTKEGHILLSERDIDKLFGKR